MSYNLMEDSRTPQEIFLRAIEADPSHPVIGKALATWTRLGRLYENDVMALDAIQDNPKEKPLNKARAHGLRALVNKPGSLEQAYAPDLNYRRIPANSPLVEMVPEELTIPCDGDEEAEADRQLLLESWDKDPGSPWVKKMMDAFMRYGTLKPGQRGSLKNLMVRGKKEPYGPEYHRSR